LVFPLEGGAVQETLEPTNLFANEWFAQVGQDLQLALAAAYNSAVEPNRPSSQLREAGGLCKAELPEKYGPVGRDLEILRSGFAAYGIT
jgi:hypothetical protein